MTTYLAAKRASVRSSLIPFHQPSVHIVCAQKKVDVEYDEQDQQRVASETEYLRPARSMVALLVVLAVVEMFAISQYRLFVDVLLCSSVFRYARQERCLRTVCSTRWAFFLTFITCASLWLARSAEVGEERGAWKSVHGVRSSGRHSRLIPWRLQC
jgi:hypothetical protein